MRIKYFQLLVIISTLLITFSCNMLNKNKEETRLIPKPFSDRKPRVLDMSEFEETTFYDLSLEKRCSGLEEFVKLLVSKYLKGMELDPNEKCSESANLTPYYYEIVLKNQKGIVYSVKLQANKIEFPMTKEEEPSKEDFFHSRYYFCEDNSDSECKRRLLGIDIKDLISVYTFRKDAIKKVHPNFVNAMYTLDKFLNQAPSKPIRAYGMEIEEYVSQFLPKIEQEGVTGLRGETIFLEFIPNEDSIFRGEVKFKKPYILPLLRCENVSCLVENPIYYKVDNFSVKIYRSVERKNSGKSIYFFSMPLENFNDDE